MQPRLLARPQPATGSAATDPKAPIPGRTCVLDFTLVVSTESGPVRNSSSSFFSRSSMDMGAAMAAAVVLIPR